MQKLKKDKKILKNKYTFLLSILTMILFLFILSSTSAANNTINDTTIGGIAQGINNTSNGDNLFLQPGTYNKTNQDTNITISKNITIQGNGTTNNVTIDARKLTRIFTIGNNTVVTFINITFINGNVTGAGGAIWNNYAYSKIVFINCTFINNSATTNGGAISNIGNYTNISKCVFINNNANSGGGINNGGHYCTVANSTFINNNASAGGGIYNGRDNFTIVNSTFEDNNATAGGAFLNYQGQYTIISNSNFTFNTAIDYGGAIANIAQPGNFIVNSSSFINNTVKDGSNSVNTGGGAIFNNRLNFTVINSSFIGNYAKTNGGGINNRGNNCNINNSIFINNTAAYGGGITNNGSMSVIGNIMNDNNATNLGNMIYNNGTMGILNLTYLNNSTIILNNNTYVLLFATLTDDMGNKVTGQTISFYVNGIFVANVNSIEGYADSIYLVNHDAGIVPVNGDYDGHERFSININEGQLLITNETTVIGNINLDKSIYTVNKTIKGDITFINTGNNAAINVITKINFPSSFVLNPSSVVVSHGNFDPITNIWAIGDLTPGELVSMSFTGRFTKAGEHTISIETTGNNFENSTDSVTVLVEETSEPPIPSEPQPEPQLKPEEEQEEANHNNELAKAEMKETGIPIITILLVLLSSLSLIYRKK